MLLGLIMLVNDEAKNNSIHLNEQGRSSGNNFEDIWFIVSTHYEKCS